MYNILSHFFEFNLVLCALLVLFSSNPVYSIVMFVLSVLNMACLLILLDVELIAFLLLIVYIGAVAVLFLFLVMMLNLRLIEVRSKFLSYFPFSAVLAWFILDRVLSYYLPCLDLTRISGLTEENVIELSWIDALNYVSNVKVLGQILYTFESHIFIGCAVILLWAMVGSILITLHHTPAVRRQSIYEQVVRYRYYK